MNQNKTKIYYKHYYKNSVLINNNKKATRDNKKKKSNKKWNGVCACVNGVCVLLVIIPG